MDGQMVLKRFDDIYYKTYNSILKYVICHAKKMDDVDDIIQNIYIEVYKIIEKDYQVDDYISYVQGIASNKVKDYYRFLYKDKVLEWLSHRLDNGEDIPDKVNIEDNFISKDNINQIWDFLKGKKSPTFKIYYLYYNDGLTIKEIAMELGLTESNVKHYLYRTLKEIKELFGGE